MKKIIHFVKSSYLIVIGFVVGATSLYVGAALTIPTNIDNSVQVIKKIIISTDGISTTGSNVVVTIDNDSGNALTVIGNMNVGNGINSVAGQWSSIAGGMGNIVTGDSSIIPGGYSNRVNGNYSFAAGRFGQALHNSTFVRSDDSGGPFPSTTNRSFIIRAANGVAIGTGVPLGINSLRVRDGVNGQIAAEEYCDENGTGCIDADDLGGSLYWSGNGNHIYNVNTGWVGIGTDNPMGALDVSGTIFTNGPLWFSGANSILGFGDISLNSLGGNISLGGGLLGGVTYVSAGGGEILYLLGGRSGICSSPPCSAGDIILAHDAYFQDTSRVGIRTGSPTEALDIDGGLRVRGITGALSANNALSINSSGKVFYSTIDSLLSGNGYRGKSGINIYSANTGNVGIGTNNPVATLTVIGSMTVGNSSNQANGINSIAMGYSNTVNDYGYSAIVGGTANTINGGGWKSFIGGGDENVISGDASFSSILGGRGNAVGGDYSSIIGGYNSIANGISSVAMGSNAIANHDHTFVRNDTNPASFSSTNTNQFLIHASNGVGIDTNNPTEKLDVNGGIKIGNTTSSCNAGAAGTIRFNGANFQGCNGTLWNNLD